MHRMIAIGLFLVLSASGLAQAEDGDFANIKVRVEGIRDNKGEIGVALFNSPKGYPTHLEHAYEPKWLSLAEGPKAVDVVFEGIPFGDYAVSVLHDENGNRKLERSTLGFPEEGVGFSNDQKVKLSAPSFKASKFSISNSTDIQMVIKLDYRE